MGGDNKVCSHDKKKIGTGKGLVLARSYWQRNTKLDLFLVLINRGTDLPKLTEAFAL